MATGVVLSEGRLRTSQIHFLFVFARGWRRVRRRQSPHPAVTTSPLPHRPPAGHDARVLCLASGHRSYEELAAKRSGEEERERSERRALGRSKLSKRKPRESESVTQGTRSCAQGYLVPRP